MRAKLIPRKSGCVSRPPEAVAQVRVGVYREAWESLLENGHAWLEPLGKVKAEYDATIRILEVTLAGLAVVVTRGGGGCY